MGAIYNYRYSLRYDVLPIRRPDFKSALYAGNASCVQQMPLTLLTTETLNQNRKLRVNIIMAPDRATIVAVENNTHDLF